MSYDPTLIAPYKSGLSKYYKPFLIGNDAFVDLQNCYSWRGSIVKREGSTVLGRVAVWKTSTGITDTSPPVVTSALHGLSTGDMIYLENVLVANATIVGITSGLTTVVTTTGAHGLISGKNIVISGSAGISTVDSTITFNNTVFNVIGVTPTTLTLSVQTQGTWTSGGTVRLGNLEKKTFYVTRIDANSFSLQVLNSSTSPPANVTASGVAVSADMYLPIVGTRIFIQSSTGNEQLIVFTPKQAFLYNTSTNTFDNISFSIGGAITGITAANPAVITTTNAHGLTTGDQVLITGITGTMSTVINGIPFTITVLSPTTFSIPINTTGLTYTGAGVVGILWTGTRDNFFYTSNFATVMWTTNNVDPIRFFNGSTTAGWADLVPTVSAGVTMTKALIVLPYKGQLVALNTTEGGVVRGNRARCCQLGTPFIASAPTGFSNDANAWRSDIPGKGFFTDADTSERIVSAEIIQDVLIVGFQFSTWRLTYTGNPTQPFIWERINTQLGSEGTFSIIPFDEKALMISRRGIVGASFNDVQRIDLEIPDTVDDFETGVIGEGLNRVHGIRDFQRRLVYWIYGDQEQNAQTPNRVLCFNYQDNTWSTFNQSFTCLGNYKKTTDNTWSTWTSPWVGDSSTWSSPLSQQNALLIVAGAADSRIWSIMDEDVSTDNGANYNIVITTNLINPYFAVGKRCKLAFYDLYLQTTGKGQITLENFTDNSDSEPWLVKTVNTNNNSIDQNPSRDTKYIRVFLGMSARQHQIRITMTPAQLSDVDIGGSDFELQGVIFHTRIQGRIDQ